jgi:TolB protein
MDRGPAAHRRPLPIPCLTPTYIDAEAADTPRAGERQITPVGSWDSYPDWSPDGKWIAFARFLPAQGNRIFNVRWDGHLTTQLTHNAINDSQPTWSPKGDRIAFTRGGEESDPAHIYTITPVGKKLTQLTFGKLNRDLFPAWQPLPFGN